MPLPGDSRTADKLAHVSSMRLLEGDERYQDLDGQSLAVVAVDTRRQRSVIEDLNLAGVTGRSVCIRGECRLEISVKCVLGAVNGDSEILKSPFPSVARVSDHRVRTAAK